MVKHYLTHAPLLRTPGFDKPFNMVADASKLPSRAMLLQGGQPTEFDSKKLNTTEWNGTTTEQGMLALARTVQAWHCNL